MDATFDFTETLKNTTYNFDNSEITYNFADTFRVDVVGATGSAGFSPIVTITEGTGERTISITDLNGTKSTVIKDGDEYSIKFIEQTLTDEQQAQARVNIGIGLADLSEAKTYLGIEVS